MKKTLFAAVSALAISAAIAADSTQFGVLQVPSSATNTIVSVPWLESGTGSDAVLDAVKVADLVLTAGLSENDELRLYENGSWTKAWQLKNGKWVGAQIVVTGGSTASGDDSTRIARGKAIMLIRKNPGACFYIMGKPASAAVHVPLGSGYSLVAPPSVEVVDVNTGIAWTNITANDKLMVPSTTGSSMVTYSFVKGKWSKWQNKKWNSENIKIAAGTGAWFVDSGDGSDKGFTFGSVAD